MEEDAEPQVLPAVESAVSAPEIEPPPPSGLYENFEQLRGYVQGPQLANGAALMISQSSNPREVNGTMMPMNVILVCDRDS